ncbi:MAG: ParB N-terminal domain-containing protein [Deltaproteobacteria bacterium]|jgi:ParB family transcriptional regulator, chromosome partitioning protein|nr:ParB N-terminal domain-containing protein [Deltaproteobacteria bacterium]
MKIEQIPIGHIKPYKHNPKTHPQGQIDQIAKSIQNFGFQIPLLVDEKNVLIAGHGRLLAAKQLKLKTIPVIRADNITPEQIRAYRIADNKLAEGSAWDFQALAADFTLAEIEALAPSTGLTPEDLNAFIDATHQPLTPEEAAAAANQAAPGEDITDFEKQMQEPVEPKMAIIPQYCEGYTAFVIICENTVDETFMRQTLALEDLAKSYSDSKIGRANILTVEKFKALWESR